MTVGSWVLPVLPALPLAAAVLLLAARRLPQQLALALAGGAALVTLLLALAAAAAAAPFDRGVPGLEVDRSWIPALGVRFHLGLDGVSVPLVLLTAVLSLLVCLHLLRSRPPGPAVQGLAACVLAVEGGALATFLALDLLLFFVAFEIVLVPMWFVIACWGDGAADRGDGEGGTGARSAAGRATAEAAYRFLLYTALGSAVMLLGLLVVALHAGTTDVVVLAARGGEGLGRSTQLLAAALIAGGLAVKVPVFPLHTWLPPAHTAAPTVGSVLLAGVLLKMGTYGLVRIALPVVPDGMRQLAPALAVLGVVGILWAGLACLLERDLKRLIAFSSVAHMGFVLVGVASMTSTGVQGALFGNVAHGLISALLFLVAGSVKDRHHTADLASIGGGLRDRMPRLGWLLAFAALAGLGLPGLAGFWGEFLAMAGAWDADDALGWLARPVAVACAFGTALAAAYLLRMLRLAWHGEAPAPGARGAARDASGLDLLVAAPLVLATVVLGLLPWLVLNPTAPAVRQVVATLSAGGAR